MAGAEEINITFIIVIGTLGMLLLAVGIVLFILVYQRKLHMKESSHQKELLEATIAIQEKERNRIAQDLHDEIGAMLSAVKLGMNTVHRKVKDNEEISSLTVETKGMIDDAIQNVRRISKELLPATLKEFGLMPALEELCTRINRSTEVEVSFYPSGNDQRYDYKYELAIFRASQELINNSLKHAEAKQIRLSLHSEQHLIELKHQDDGVGFDQKEVASRDGMSSGLGMKNIESRISVADSNLVIDTGHGKGTKVHITMQIP